MKIDTKKGLISYHGGEIFNKTWVDPDGYEHKYEGKADGMYHTSDRPYCLQCGRFKDIYKDEHSFTEMCSICGQGSGTAWS